MTEHENIRAAFRYVTLGLMEWQDPPELTRREYAALEGVYPRRVLRPLGKETLYGTAEYVDPFNVSDDWEERS